MFIKHVSDFYTKKRFFTERGFSQWCVKARFERMGTNFFCTGGNCRTCWEDAIKKHNIEFVGDKKLIKKTNIKGGTK